MGHSVKKGSKKAISDKKLARDSGGRAQENSSVNDANSVNKELEKDSFDKKNITGQPC